MHTKNLKRNLLTSQHTPRSHKNQVIMEKVEHGKGKEDMSNSVENLDEKTSHNTRYKDLIVTTVESYKKAKVGKRSSH